MPKRLTYSQGVENWKQWISILFQWLWFNVFLGGIAIVLSIFVWLPFKSNHPFPSDVALGLIVMGITIVMTNTDFPVELREFSKECMTWLPKGAYTISTLGIASSIFASLGPYLEKPLVPPDMQFNISVGILISSIVLGIAGFVIKTRASEAYFSKVVAESQSRDEYAAEVDDAGARIANQAKTSSEYNGMKI